MYTYNYFNIFMYICLFTNIITTENKRCFNNIQVIQLLIHLGFKIEIV